MSFYEPPKTIPTTVFSVLPDEFKGSVRPGDWLDANRPGGPRDGFLEGPSFDRDGNLYVTDIPYGRIFRISPDGEWTLVADYDGWPNGLKFHKDGRGFIADYKNGIMVLDPVSGRVEPLLTHIRSEGFKGVNDLVFDRNGVLYFTDQGQTGMHDPTGRVFRYDLSSGEIKCLVDTGPSPNGLVFNPEETLLFVGMTRGNAVWRIPVYPDGSTSKVGIFAQMAGGVGGADGLAADVDGNISVCDFANGCVWTFSKWGVPIYRIEACTEGRGTTNLAYGGPDGRSLFITESETNSILRAEMPAAGVQMYGLS